MSAIKSFPRLAERDAEELLQRLLSQSESREAVSADAMKRLAMAPSRLPADASAFQTRLRRHSTRLPAMPLWEKLSIVLCHQTWR